MNETNEKGFKAGDRVRALEVGAGITRGEVFTVTGVGCGSVRFVDHDGDSRYRPADRYELVASPVKHNLPAQLYAFRDVDGDLHLHESLEGVHGNEYHESGLLVGAFALDQVGKVDLTFVEGV